MEPVRIAPDKDGVCSCPECGGKLTFIEYMPVQVIDGKLNMEDSEPHYECGACNLIFRRIVSTEFYQSYERKVSKNIEPFQIKKGEGDKARCPRCNSKLVFIAAMPAHIYNGRLNMEDCEAHYECGCCNLSFRPLVCTDFYQTYDRHVEFSMDAIKLAKDKDGKVACPRCKEGLRFAEYEPVQVVGGRVNLDKGEAHYECDHCHLAYRRIVHTDFYQVYGKKM
jgi:uncharacterized protein with PIN domain